MRYLPNQPILQTERDTRKLRIVFDVSSETNNEPSFEPVITLGTMFMAVIIQNITSISTRKICYL